MRKRIEIIYVKTGLLIWGPFCRVDTQIACMGDLGADTARFFRERAVLGAVWAVKSALYAF